MGTLATIVAGIVLAGAATVGVVTSQADAPGGGGLPAGGTVVSYEQGQ